MPPNFFQKPETALKRAQELISVGKELDALQTLHDTIKSKRHKQWTKTHEQIMLKHVELCVALRRPHIAKEALFQYKVLTQQVAVQSLETVIHHFLELAQQKTEEAQKTSIEKVEEIDDLDQADAPENLLLSAVSGAAAQDRMDRTVLSPWLRFLWDSYRNCLDLLRNNAVVEQLYHRIARQSFEFCAKYQRRAEFRKLCDHLRIHLSQIQKQQHLAHIVKLSSADSLTLMQDTRLIQLDTAIQMELWQEAYRSAEDVHGMMQLSKDKDKRMVKPASYVNYYDKLALVFWKAGNRLFHATALLQKFIIYKDMKKTFSVEEALEQATRVLLATLSIPDGADAPSDLTRHLDIEEQHVANMRLLSNLLRLPIAPTRNGILKELVRLNIPEIASENARALYKLLECKFLPLRLAKEVQMELEKIISLNREDYNQYVDSIRTVTATKAIKQLSLIYETVSLDRIKKVIPFYNGVELERFLVDIFKHRYVKAQIDHRKSSIRFGVVDATLAGSIDPDPSNGFISRDAAQVGLEGIRGHLELMYNGLRDIVGMLEAEEIREAALENLKRHVEVYNFHKNSDYERILQRRKKIETYKETSERKRMEKSQKAQMEAMKREEQKRAEEMRRLEVENAEKERLRKIAEQEELDRKVRAEKMKKIQSTPIYQAIVKDHGEEAFQNMDPESVLREQRDRLDEQRRELQARLQQQEKKFDHMVRAFHLEEIVIRARMSAEFQKMAPIRHEEHQRHRVEAAIEEHERAVATYDRMQKVRSDAKEFLEMVLDAHKEDFEKKMDLWKQKLDDERRKALAIRHEQRKEKRRQEWLAEREREAMKAREAEEQARREEKDRERRAAKEAVKREVVESKSDRDTDWRQAARMQSSMPSRPSAKMGGSDRFRERPPQPPSEADSGTWSRGNVVTGPSKTADSYRSGTQPQRNKWESVRVPETDASRRSEDGVGGHKDSMQSRHMDRRVDSNEMRQANGRATSSASRSDNWRQDAGNVVEAPHQQQQTAASKPTGTRYVPPHRARGSMGLSSGDRQTRQQPVEQPSSSHQNVTNENDSGGKWSLVSKSSDGKVRRTVQAGGADGDKSIRKKN